MSCDCPFCPLIEANVQVCGQSITKTKEGRYEASHHSCPSFQLKNRALTTHLVVILNDIFKNHVRVGGEMGFTDEYKKEVGCTMNVKRISRRTYEVCFHVLDKNKTGAT